MAFFVPLFSVYLKLIYSEGRVGMMASRAKVIWLGVELY